MTTRILIVDDHQIVRQGVVSLLKTLRPAWVVTEAEDSIQALQLVQKEKTSLIIMDITITENASSGDLEEWSR